MKHLDIRPLIDAVKNIEAQEARKALAAYGGSCTFSPGNPPAVEFSRTAGPAQASVKKIRLTPDRRDIVLEVWDEEGEGTFELTPSDLYEGSLLSVVDYM